MARKPFGGGGSSRDFGDAAATRQTPVRPPAEAALEVQWRRQEARPSPPAMPPPCCISRDTILQRADLSRKDRSGRKKRSSRLKQEIWRCHLTLWVKNDSEAAPRVKGSGERRWAPQGSSPLPEPQTPKESPGRTKRNRDTSSRLPWDPQASRCGAASPTEEELERGEGGPKSQKRRGSLTGPLWPYPGPKQLHTVSGAILLPGPQGMPA